LRFEFAALLLEAGANPNVVDNDAGMGPLYAAVDIHRLAVGHGRPNPKPVGLMTPVQLVELLLERGADADARLRNPSFNGSIPLETRRLPRAQHPFCGRQHPATSR
jgi:hypothetical protein